MPALPSWYAHLPDILASLETAPPILDRPAFEKLFRVSRRQAIRLMGAMGGYQVGKTFVVERNALTEYLTTIREKPEARRAHERKRRILHYIQERVAAPVSPGPEFQWNGIGKDGPGRLIISYTSATDLLGKIATLVASATEDYPRFREHVE